MAPRTFRNPWGMPQAGTVPKTMMPAQNASRTILTPAAKRAGQKNVVMQQLLRNKYVYSRNVRGK